MSRSPRLLALLACLCTTAAFAAKGPPPMSADALIRAGAHGAVAASTCGRGGVDLHRRNARDGVRQALQARRALPADFDARFARAHAAAARQIRAMKPAERTALCTRMAAQGVRFRSPPAR